MNDRQILLVEDNPKDEELTLRAFKKSNIMNTVVVARDGVEALDYVFARGSPAHRGCNPAGSPRRSSGRSAHRPTPRSHSSPHSAPASIRTTTMSPRPILCSSLRIGTTSC